MRAVVVQLSPPGRRYRRGHVTRVSMRDPTYRAKVVERLQRGAETARKAPEWRGRNKQQLTVALKKRWASPGAGERAAERMRTSWATPHVRDAWVAAQRKAAADPVKRAAHRAAMSRPEVRLKMSKSAIETGKRADIKKMRSENSKESNARPSVVQKKTIAMCAAWQRGCREKRRATDALPDVRARRSKVAKEVQARSSVNVKRAAGQLAHFKSKRSNREIHVGSLLEPWGFAAQVQIGGYVCDFVHTDKRVIIEYQGCYWHGCVCRWPVPDARREAMIAKDARKKAYLEAHGWCVVYVWEHEAESVWLRRIQEIFEI